MQETLDRPPYRPWSAGDPMVSVITITYQHAAFIGQNIASVASQRTDFAVEHLIGEDQSTDGTREICSEAAEKDPRIRLFLRDRKNVMHIMGRPTGRANVLGLYLDARGKYLAVCPGDDHWIDENKLQLQVDLMESRPELVACFTNGWNDRNGKRTDYVRSWLNGQIPRKDITVRDLLEGNFIPACTFLFRRDRLFPLPEAIFTSPISDKVLVVHLAAQGPIAFIDRHCGVRNVHDKGLISMRDQAHKIEVNVRTLTAIAGSIAPADRPFLDQRIIRYRQEMLQSAIDRGELAQARGTWRALNRMPAFRAGFRERLRRGIQLYVPWLARTIFRIRSSG